MKGWAEQAEFTKIVQFPRASTSADPLPPLSLKDKEGVVAKPAEGTCVRRTAARSSGLQLRNTCPPASKSCQDLPLIEPKQKPTREKQN